MTILYILLGLTGLQWVLVFFVLMTGATFETRREFWTFIVPFAWIPMAYRGFIRVSRDMAEMVRQEYKKLK